MRELEAVLARAERPQQDAVLAARAAREHEVLRRPAVDRQGEHGRLAPAHAPLALGARHVDRGHDLGRPLEREGLLVEGDGGS